MTSETNQPSSGNPGDFLRDETLDKRNYLPEPFHKRAKNAVINAIGDANDRRLSRQFDRRSRQMQVLEEMDSDGTSSPTKRRRGRIAVPASMAVASLLILSPRARETADNIIDGIRDIPENIDKNLENHNGPPQGDLAPNPSEAVVDLSNQQSLGQGGLPLGHNDLP